MTCNPTPPSKYTAADMDVPLVEVKVAYLWQVKSRNEICLE